MAPLATYLPESQIITLKKDMGCFQDPDNLEGFPNIQSLSVFFHEWIHFLHNVSTTNGLVGFSQQIVLWSNFRWSINEKGHCIGSMHRDDVESENNLRIIRHLFSRVKSGKGSIPGYINPNDISLHSYELKNGVTTNGYWEVSSKIACKFMSQGAIFDVEIGILEIIESVAYMLETRLVEKMDGTPLPSPIIPYQLVYILSKGISPKLKKDEIICAMLTALQNNDPAAMLLVTLEEIKNRKRKKRQSILNDIAVRNIMEFKDSISEQLNQIESLFPVDEPMGDFVKLTIKRLKRNIKARIKKPFFELSIVEHTAKNPNYLNECIRKYGGCALISERHGDDNDVGRDVIYEFMLNEHKDDYSEGLQIARSSFHFLNTHLDYSTGGFVSSASITCSFKCPFFTTCEVELRKNMPDICANEPWLSIGTKQNLGCVYARAVRATAPPPDNLTYKL